MARPVAHGLAHAGNRRIDEVLSRPGGFGAANSECEVAQDIRAQLGVADFGMELHCPHLSLGSFDGGHRTGRAGHEVKSGRQFDRFVAVRHPDGKPGGEAFEKTGAVLDLDVGMAVLALVGGANLATQGVHHELEPVTDAEHGQAQFEHAPVRGRRVGVIHRRGSAGKNDA